MLSRLRKKRMINDLIFRIAAEHSLQNLDGSNPNNMIELTENTERTYRQLLTIYSDLDKKLKAERKTPEVHVRVL